MLEQGGDTDKDTMRIETDGIIKEKVQADLIIMAVGAVPNSRFLKESAVTLEWDGAIECNELLESR